MKKFVLLCILFLLPFALPLTACKSGQGERTSYDIYASYDESKDTLTATMTVNYRNQTANELADLKFNLYGNAYREGAKYAPVSTAEKNRAYYEGASYGSMTVQNVENCSGWTVAGEDENLLIVNLSTPLSPNEWVQIKVAYTLQLAHINHRTGVTAHTVNLGNFYPIVCADLGEGAIACNYYHCGDPFLSEVADYTITLECAERFVVASSGKAVKSTTTNSRTTHTMQLDCARDFALVLSTEFQVAELNMENTLLRYYYRTGDGQKALEVASRSLQYFSKNFGNYPYPTLSVVQTGFCYGGMEYPALTMISDSLSESNQIYTIVHENAHQWWYGMVGSDSLQEAWQDEGLAEYTTALFFEKHPDYAFTKTAMLVQAKKAYRAYFTVYEQLFGKVDTSMSRHLSTFTSEYEYSNIAYNKGLILFDTVAQTLGEEQMLSCLKKYCDRYRFCIATKEQLLDTLSAGGCDLDGLFDAFLHGKVIL